MVSSARHKKGELKGGNMEKDGFKIHDCYFVGVPPEPFDSWGAYLWNAIEKKELSGLEIKVWNKENKVNP